MLLPAAQAQRLRTKTTIRRIGLISPYTGGNLGNAAIISAMIANLRKHITGVEFVGITLYPDYVRRRHGIQAFPLAAALSRPFYTLVSSESSAIQPPSPPKLARIRLWARRISWLQPCLRAYRVCRAKFLEPIRSRYANSTCVRAFHVCRAELGHIAAAARLVRTLDWVIVAGGGPLDDSFGGPWAHPWSLFKWGLLSRAYGVRYLFLSVGKSIMERRLTRFFVGIALRSAHYRSYRDEESKLGVQSLIDARRDPVYPDLAFSYAGAVRRKSQTRASQDGRLLIGVSPIAYRDPRSWPVKNEERFATYVSQLTAFVKWLLDQRHRILFFTTDGPDAAVVDDMQAILSASAVDLSAIQILPESTGRSVEGFLEDISCADLVIASRLHGVILSHLNAIPVLALSFDPKVDAHMNAMRQKEYCLSIDRFQLETLIERFSALKAARLREQDRLRSTGQRFRHRLELQYDELLGEASSGPMRDNAQSQFQDFSASIASGPGTKQGEEVSG